MNDFTQGYLVGVASMWIGAALALGLRWLWQQRKIALSPDWAHKTVPVGRILSMTEDENGITAEGIIDDPKTAKLIKDGTITGLSLDMHPNAFGYGVEVVTRDLDSTAVYRDARKIIDKHKEN